MILNINDSVISDSQAESLLQLSEGIQQGSLSRGMGGALCSGIIVSSNSMEPHR